MLRRCTVTVMVKLPLVPAIVNVNVPVGVFLAVETVSVEFAGDGGNVTEVGLSLQVACDGQPVTLRFTVPVNPFKAVTVVV